jgi:hypothetical protein
VHLLYCDESNLEERDGDFLVYGGLAVDGGRSRELSREIDRIRGWAGVDRTFKLKFNPGPSNLSHQEFSALKQSVVEASIRFDAKL